MKVSGSTRGNVKLVLGDVIKDLSKDFKPMQFELGRLRGETVDNTTLILHIPLMRYYDYHCATTFFPTFCLLAIACMTLCIDPQHFQATIALSLTTMLVMQTLQENISDDLPKTAYIKMVDLWLIMGMINPFVVFLVLVVVEMLPNEQGEEEIQEIQGANVEMKNRQSKPKFTKGKVHFFFKILIPSTTLVFMLAFFTVVMFITRSNFDEFYS